MYIVKSLRLVSSTVSKSNTVTQRYPKTSTTRRRHVHRKVSRRTDGFAKSLVLQH